MNIFFEGYNCKQVLSVHALMVFKIFCFLVDKKIKLKVFWLALLKLLTNAKNPFCNLLQRPYSSDLDTENAYRKPPVIL
jgi:hypothetical protein